MSHEIDPEGLPYDPKNLDRKEYVGFGDFVALDLRTGIITQVEDFPEMRKPSYKITVDFGPVVGSLQSSAQITNYRKSELIGRMVVGAINLGDKTLPTGFISQFLVLGALEADGTVKLLELPDDVVSGSVIA